MTDALAGAAPVPFCLAHSLLAHSLAAVVAMGLVRAAPGPAPARTLVAFEMVDPPVAERRPPPAPAVERPLPAARAPSPVAPSPRAPRPVVVARPTPAAPAAPAAAAAPTAPAAPAAPAAPILTAQGGAESVAAAPPSAAPSATAGQGGAHAPAPAQAEPGPTLDVGAYLSGLTARVSRFRTYPAIAQEMGLEGTVVVRVVVRADGSLAAAPSVDASSGHDVLDDEALRIVARAAPFAPPLGHDGSLTLRVPVRFHLED